MDIGLEKLLTNCVLTDELPFEFKALELALELTCMSLDAQVRSITCIFLTSFGNCNSGSDDA